MPIYDVIAETPVPSGFAVDQVRGMFDLAAEKVARVEFHVELPADEELIANSEGTPEPWRIGLIVGPSGTEQDVMRDVLFARGLRRKDALQFRRAITGAHTPIVLVGHEAPDDDFWQGSVPPILRLNEVATLTDGNLAIDGAQALGLIRATEVRNATAKKREGQKQRESVRRVLKQEIKSLVTEDNLVAAYKKYGSYNKAVDGLAAEGVSTNRSAIERAVKKQGGAKAVMRRDDSESIVRTVSSRRRDTPIKKRD